MTLATQITVARLALIPLFVAACIVHGQAELVGNDAETTWRMVAIVTFGVISAGDWLDGYVARVRNERSQLGAVLDPLTDKLLNLAAVLALAFSGWQPQIPPWFAFLALLRDVVILWFAITIQRRNGHLEVIPLLTGKLATTFQMITVGWVMLRLDLLLHLPVILPALLAGIFVTISGFTYYFYGMRQLAYPLDQTPKGKALAAKENLPSPHSSSHGSSEK
jgi:CDP-diacylglycerol--glycerol-3-phosphate 3-phosphatidyltransferase